MPCCGTRHLAAVLMRLAICRPLPLAQVAYSATGGAPIAPLPKSASLVPFLPKQERYAAGRHQRHRVRIRPSPNGTAYRTPYQSKIKDF